MVKLSDFEANLIKLRWIENRLLPIYELFPKKKNDKYTESLQRVLRETIIVQLHNFIKIRKKLIMNSKIKELDDCLETLWKPIVELKDPIQEIRNEYIAHIQERGKPFNKMPGDILFPHGAPTTLGDWVFLAGCVAAYSDLVYANIKTEWDKAEEKYKTLMPLPELHGFITMKNYRQKTKTAYESAKKELRDKGFVDSDYLYR